MERNMIYYIILLNQNRYKLKTPEVYINDVKLENVQQIKYLGVILTNTFKDDMDIARQLRSLPQWNDHELFMNGSWTVHVQFMNTYSKLVRFMNLWVHKFEFMNLWVHE